jgi:hypothetical protein
MPLVRQPKDFDDESETFEHCSVARLTGYAGARASG